MEEKKNYKICVYAICKNESKFVEKWVENMSEADYICILDTGSEDDTYDKIRMMYARFNKENNPCKIIFDRKVFNPWRFDDARNASLAFAPEDTDIFVCTDLDELFVPGWGKILRDNWKEEYERVAYMYTWSHLDNGEPGRVFKQDKIHGPNWKWRFPVHEALYLEEQLTNPDRPVKYLYLADKIMMHHWPDKHKSRSSYLPLLEQRAKEYPDDMQGLIYLAHEYFYRNKYKESIETLEKIMARDDYKKLTNIEKASCYFFRGDDYKGLGEYGKALSDYMTASNIAPTLREPYLKMASVMFELKFYDSAIELCRTAIKKGVRHNTWLEKDHSWSYEPYDIMCLAAYYGGHKKDSLAYAYKAHSFDTANERLKNNIDLILKTMTDDDFID